MRGTRVRSLARASGWSGVSSLTQELHDLPQRLQAIVDVTHQVRRRAFLEQPLLPAREVCFELRRMHSPGRPLEHPRRLDQQVHQLLVRGDGRINPGELEAVDL